ncbi:alanyl-tRNA editing protein [Sporosarcina limicola]|uniref:Alanyl-tRNA synthetase n=1 Tax=Sporosarcina limicola TaxID=34101 RepID=A0A927MKG2_9BACL|nr:alanine--tRNA ligase-related protein [Sporosarcina limicola]MBE1556253.1 alanyl-tRNA synthetase [Sporosarcina limicola]
MLKNRLYYENPYCKTFSSSIVKSSQDTDSNSYVVLENTAFYPTGGGQPYDTGTLNGVRVLNVEEVEGEIRHTMEEVLDSTDEVVGVVDWERRFDHMQQHAGQHILTAAFVELFGFPTVSFHLGKEIVSIDLAVEGVSLEQLDAAEKLANVIIVENRLIETKWVTENELDNYSLRKQLAVSDEIRLVIIPDLDYNGCGGTHPSSTGEVGVLKILSTEKEKRKVRVHFVCGGRVVEQLHKKNRELAATSKLLSAPEDGVAASVEKLLESNHFLEKSLKEMRETILTFEAKDLLNKQEDGIVKASFANRTVQELQKLSKLLVAETADIIVLLVAESDGRLQFVAARGASVETSMKQVASAILPAINGKGGGSDAFVQGGGEPTISADELLQEMVESLEHWPSSM